MSRSFTKVIVVVPYFIPAFFSATPYFFYQNRVGVSLWTIPGLGLILESDYQVRVTLRLQASLGQSKGRFL